MNSTPSDLNQPASPDSKAPADLDPSATATQAPTQPVNDAEADLDDRPVHFEDLVERCMGNIELATRLLNQSGCNRQPAGQQARLVGV